MLSCLSLKYMNVAMVTVLKNTTNILTAIGEFYLFKKKQNGRVWAALFLMVGDASLPPYACLRSTIVLK